MLNIVFKPFWNPSLVVDQPTPLQTIFVRQLGWWHSYDIPDICEYYSFFLRYIDISDFSIYYSQLIIPYDIWYIRL